LCGATSDESCGAEAGHVYGEKLRGCHCSRGRVIQKRGQEIKSVKDNVLNLYLKDSKGANITRSFED